MNPEHSSGSPIFLPPLQFRDGRDIPASAIGQRKNSLPSIHSGFPFSTVTAGRKFSLPWLMEETATTFAPVIGETSLSSGIRISARELSRPTTSSQFEFSVGLHGTLTRDCSLPGQLEDEENNPPSPGKYPANTPVSATSQKTIGSNPSTFSDTNLETSEKVIDRNCSQTSSHGSTRWRELWSEAKRMGHNPQNSEDSYNNGYYNMQPDNRLLLRQRSESFASQISENDYRRSSIITEQPRFSSENILLDEYENPYSYNQARRISRSLPQSGYDSQTGLPGQTEKQNFQNGYTSTDTKDIKVNMAKAGTAVVPFSTASGHPVEPDVEQSSNEGLLPQQPQITCPHCGEQFPPPPDVKSSSSSSGCSGTISNLCTYVAMAGVVLIGTGICICLPFCIKLCKDANVLCPWWQDLFKEILHRYNSRAVPEPPNTNEATQNYISTNFNPFNALGLE